MPIEMKFLARDALRVAGKPLPENILLHEAMEKNGTALADLLIALSRSADPLACATLARLTHYTRANAVQIKPLGKTCPYLESGEPDNRRVVWYQVRNPCQVGTEAWERYSLVRKGLTVTQLRTRGVSTRMVREWVSAGHLKLLGVVA